MADSMLLEHLEFLTMERGQDEATVLAEALRTGVEALYRDALTEAYLGGRVAREDVLLALGEDELARIERQRDALRRDVEWAARGA
jgi:hypothetical protein